MKKGVKYYIHNLKRNFKKPITITDLCVGCGKCVGVCPVPEVISAGKPYSIDRERCMRCSKCIPVCPVGAIIKL